MTTINEKSLAKDLAKILEEWAETNGIDARARDFEEAGVVSDEAGFVVKIQGKEFQVTVVRSK